ncbi:MAG: LysR family transcriptional regulator [Nocardioides sp.]|uniref:LysR family transcriptional regulator n=1 Tax=Nocardioides sp. TaxID=35761 RepID=UPI000C9866F7|nr:LysR family transcriptional regulator [Nocardioides sp.]MAS54381.1 LysR family transcriptional regulator [Pimelobacter sp.]MDE0777074.1 LysR family transcriptional regulator [Nocardioides sp.]
MTPHVPDLDGLRLLVLVARLGSIGAAARAQGTTQQAASERVRTMEAVTGLGLVRRGPRGSELTDAGVVVVERAAHLLSVADELEAVIDGLRDDHDRDLSVWASMTIAETLIPRWLVQLRHRQLTEGVTPTTVSLTASNSTRVIDAVRDGRADLGFVEGGGTPSGVRHTAVAEDELVLVVAPGTPLSRRRTPLTAAQVSELALVQREQGSGTRDVLESALAAHGLAPGPAVAELTTATAVRATVLAGGSAAFLSRRVVARDLDLGHLVEVPTALRLQRAFRAVWAGARQPPAGPVRNLVGIARTSAE